MGKGEREDGHHLASEQHKRAALSLLAGARPRSHRAAGRRQKQQAAGARYYQRRAR